MSHMRITFFLCLLAASAPASAQSGSANVSSACLTLEFMAKMVAINVILPAAGDNLDGLNRVLDELHELNTLACQPVILTADTRRNSTYENGRRVSVDLYDSAWHFPNGERFVAEPGENTEVRYPNGVVMAGRWLRTGQTLYWPNGRVATNDFRERGRTWFYPSGDIITHEAGDSGERWFYPIQNLDGGAGQQLIASNWGEEDESFNFLSFAADGRVVVSRERIRRQLVFSDAELLDVPGIVLLLTRLYRVEDSVKLFAPADINISARPPF